MTRSQIKGEVWQILFEKKGNFHENFEAVSPFGEFLPKKKKGIHGIKTYLIYSFEIVNFSLW